MKELNISKLYKIEWGLDDNANAWLEPTTHCQLSCPKCFRGTGKEGYSPEHRDLEEIKKEILILKEKRNVESITLGGGEPLLYPQIIEVVEYCKKNGIKVRICTNAILLNEELLRKLKKAGVNEILIHLDRYQGRGSKEELFALRDYYCNIFRKVKGVNLGFMTMINELEGDYVGELIDYYQKNVDIIILISFIFTKDIFKTIIRDEAKTEKLDQLIGYINKRYNCQPSAYIGKTITDEVPAWLIYMTIFCGVEPIGGMDYKVYGFTSRLYRKVFGRHWFLTNKKTVNFFKLLIFIFNRNTRRLLTRFFKKNAKAGFRKKMNYQIITVNFGPDKLSEGWDLCDSCPDAMYYQGEFVPSCLLEKIKKGEKISWG